MFISICARPDCDRCAAGDPSRTFADGLVGGLCETQSCTSRDTLGFVSRLVVFLEDGLLVMMIVGVFLNGVEGRYV